MVIVPLAMLALKAIFRLTNRFHTERPDPSSDLAKRDIRVVEDVHEELENVQGDPSPAPLPQSASKKPLKRRHPPISLADTVIGDGAGGWISVHGQMTVFQDDDILRVCPLTEEQTVDGVPISYLQTNGKVVIQQQSIRGCTAAAATMLLVDHHKRPDAPYLRQTNLGTKEMMYIVIERAGCRPKMSVVPRTLSGLREAVLQSGSAIVEVNVEGGHVVVVDDINEDLTQVTIRDPYHGWAIVVKGEAFQKTLEGGTARIIQIE